MPRRWRPAAPRGRPVVGKTHTDELAYSLAGSNCALRRPRQPAGAGRDARWVLERFGGRRGAQGWPTSAWAPTPPARSGCRPAWCGLFGLRPTWGRISIRGVMALGPSHDTVGRHDPRARPARDGRRPAPRAGADGAAEVTRVPRTGRPVAVPAPPVVILHWNRCSAGSRSCCRSRASAPLLQSRPPSTLARTFTVTQGAQVWRTFGDWVTGSSSRARPGCSRPHAGRVGAGPWRRWPLAHRAATECVSSLRPPCRAR